METQYLAHAGGSLAYDDQGSGQLVVCVPGMGDLRGVYRFLAPQLVAAGYRVVTMDVRGHGETSVAWPDYSVAAIGSDIVAIIRQLDAGPAVIVGGSMASAAAVWAAAEAPSNVAGLILVGPVVRDLMSQTLARLIFSLLFAAPWGVKAWMMYWRTLYPTTKPSDFETYQQKLRANLREPGRLRALRRMITASKAAATARLAEVAIPTLVVMGTKDPDFKDPAAEAHFVGEQLHGSVEMIDGAGHYPQAEMPEQSTPHILTFLQTIEAAVPHDA